jgi:hypothetical protein
MASLAVTVGLAAAAAMASPAAMATLGDTATRANTGRRPPDTDTTPRTASDLQAATDPVGQRGRTRQLVTIAPAARPSGPTMTGGAGTDRQNHAAAMVGNAAQHQNRGTGPGHHVTRRVTGRAGRRRERTAPTRTVTIPVAAGGIQLIPRPEIRQPGTPGRTVPLAGRQVLPGRLARGRPHCRRVHPRAEFRRQTRR